MPRVAEDSYSTPVHPYPPYEGFYYTVIICQGEQRTINHPCPPPHLMRGSTILLSYAEGSRGLLITPAHPPPPIMRGSTILLSYAKGSRGLLLCPPQPCYPQRTINPPAHEGFYYTVIICQGEQRTINHPSPPPPPPLMRGSTILLSYAKGSRGLLITPAHPTYEGFYYTVIICQGEQRTINHPCPPPPL